MVQSEEPEQRINRRPTAIELVRHLSTEGHRIFDMAEARRAARAIGLSQAYTKEALHHLARDGWVVRLRRGLYALSSSIPGIPAVHEFEIAMALVSPAAISHWSAMSHHGMTEQIPHRVYVLTTTDASPPRARGTKVTEFVARGVPFHFIQVKPERFLGVRKIWIDEARIEITDPERTLLDGLTMPRYCGDFAEVLHAFGQQASRLDVDKLIEYALRLDAATTKRLGWVLERQGVTTTHLARLQQLPIKGYRLLDPTGPRKGPYDRRWMIQENLPGKVHP